MQPPEPADIIVDEAYDDTGGVMLTEAERDEIRVMVMQDPPHRDY
jgi:hypothetical protein